MRQLGLGSINYICVMIRNTRPQELGRQVVEAMTTNETYFYRDPSHNDAISRVLLARLQNDRRDPRKLRFWSAASSTWPGGLQSGHAPP